jgi:hypothetical protein
MLASLIFLIKGLEVQKGINSSFSLIKYKLTKDPTITSPLRGIIY